MMDKQNCLFIGAVIGFVIGLCLGLAFPFIGDKGFSAAMPTVKLGPQYYMTPCTNWAIAINSGENPHKYDYNPSIETCRGNITGPEHYKLAIEGCCKYKYGNVSP